eukprot:9809996-Prorocentrum_lima.AAC.1
MSDNKIEPYSEYGRPPPQDPTTDLPPAIMDQASCFMMHPGEDDNAGQTYHHTYGGDESEDAWQA